MKKRKYEITIKPTRKKYKGALITFVAPGSIADKCGIEEGDQLIAVDLSGPSQSFSYDNVDDDTLFQIFSIKRNKIFEIVIRDIPIGIDFRLTKENLLRDGSFTLIDMDDLACFFVDATNQEMEEIINTVFKPKLTERIFPFSSRLRINKTYSIVMQALRCYYSGDINGASKNLVEFINEYSVDYTSNVRAMLHYILGECFEINNFMEDAYNCYDEAYCFSNKLIYMKKINCFNISIGNYHPTFVGEKLNNYNLPCHGVMDKVKAKNLKESLGSIKSNELHIVCLLSGYRANGPYDQFLINFYKYTSLRPDIIKSIDIITEIKGNDSYWLDTEKKLLAAGVIQQILIDENDSTISDQLEITKSPTILALNNNGEIVYEGRFDIAKEMYELFDIADKNRA